MDIGIWICLYADLNGVLKVYPPTFNIFFGGGGANLLNSSCTFNLRYQISAVSIIDVSFEERINVKDVPDWYKIVFYTFVVTCIESR